MVTKHGVQGGKTFLCPIVPSCQAGLPDRAHLNCHIRQVHNSTYKLTCDLCGHQVKGEHRLKSHKFREHGVLEDEGSKIHECDEPGCDFKTLLWDSLRNHRRKHLTEKGQRPRSFSCHFCGKGFYTKGKLTEHEKLHKNADLKPHQCEICGASFAVQAYLYMHNRCMHSDRRSPSQPPRKNRVGKNKITNIVQDDDNDNSE